MVPQIHALKPALDAIGDAIDCRFGRILAVPDDPRRRLYQAMRHATIGGGKRMRPLLVVASGDLFGIDRERALRVALAIEAVHCYSLVHDDLPAMDNDAMRRGKPTVHKAFDVATAILTGDSLFALAFEIVTDEATHPDPAIRAELARALAKASGPAGMAGGQAMDLAAENEVFDLNTTTRLQQLKTGALISFAALSGAIMGKAGDATRRQLTGYARNLGLAFQIADDLLDVEGDPARAGKPLRKDGDAGKSTFVSLLGVEPARKQARMLVQQAIEHLRDFGSEADLLRAVAHFAVERDR